MRARFNRPAQIYAIVATEEITARHRLVQKSQTRGLS